MPTPTKGARLGGSPAHERLILANLATQLFEHGRIVTTETKAKRLRPLAEKLITKAKRGDLHARRQVMTTIRDNGVVHTLFTGIAPTFAGRDGGYTRITKVGPRKGDKAPMAVIELVTETVEEGREAKTKGAAPAKKAAAKKTPARKATAPEVPAEETNAGEHESAGIASDEATSNEAASSEVTAEQLSADESGANETVGDQIADGDPAEENGKNG